MWSLAAILSCTAVSRRHSWCASLAHFFYRPLCRSQPSFTCSQGLISGIVYGMGDVTAQAYEGRAVAQVDWGRTIRSAAIGAFAYGPLSHLVFSSEGSLIDRAVEQAAVGLAFDLHVLV